MEGGLMTIKRLKKLIEDLPEDLPVGVLAGEDHMRVYEETFIYSGDLEEEFLLYGTS